MKRTRDEPMTYKGKEIQTLKQIPRRVREQRRHYQFLTMQLIKYKVMFMWLIPEGMLISWQNKKFKIDTLDKAQEFYDQYLVTDVEQESREEIESKSQEEQQIEKKEADQDERRGTETEQFE